MPVVLHIYKEGLSFSLAMSIPDRLIESISKEEHSRDAVSLSKAICAKYEQNESEPNVFYRWLNDHKFMMNLSEDVDASMQQICMDFMLHGVYEPETTKLVESIVKPGMNVVDVGASIGYFTLLLARQVGPDGKVLAVEPTKNQFPFLQKNVEINGYTDRVTLLNNAAGNQVGPVTIQCNAINGAEAEGIILDDVITEPVDFIKIDTDGSDLRVLQGLEKTIQNSPNLKMVVEYYPKYLKNLGSDPAEFLAFLDKYFTYTVIDGDYGEDECWNYYCVKKH